LAFRCLSGYSSRAKEVAEAEPSGLIGQETQALGRLGQIAGVLLLVIGAGLFAWGGPYYMLDWGGTFVIAGAVLASAGLICLLLGVALQRLSALRSDILMLRAAKAVDAAPSGRAVDGPDLAPVSSEVARKPLPDTQPADQGSVQVSASGGPAGAVLAGGLAAGGLAAAAKSILGAVTPDPAAGASEPDSAGMALPGTVVAADREHALSGTGGIAADPALPLHAAPTFGEPSWDQPALAGGGSANELTASDHHALDDLLACLAGPVADQTAADQPAADRGVSNGPGSKSWDEEPAFSPAAGRLADSDLGTFDDEVASHLARRDDLFARFDQAVRRITQDAGEGAASVQGEPAETPEPRLGLASEPGEPADAADAPWQGEVLPDVQSVIPLAVDEDTPTNSGARHDEDEAPAAADRAGRPLKVRTDDVDDDFAELRADLNTPSHGPFVALPGQHSAAVAMPEGPTASDEGVVAAYNVGDSAYAMLADGRIRVTTPEGQYLFQSMEELKAFMVARRSAD
jgi:hypothetical protein